MPAFTWLSEACRVMGVLNVTPDSFSDGGDFVDVPAACQQAIVMESAGASVIDIGGESTRPGSDAVPASLQINRVVPVIQALKGKLKIPISIDTTRAAVAREALKAGATIVNDVSAGLDDPEMIQVVVKFQAPTILMHRLEPSKTMQDDVHYRDIVGEVLSHLLERAGIYEKAGLSQDKICLDPGIGFGKFLEHNLMLTRSLTRFVETNYAILYGASRKNFIGELLNIKDPKERDEATALFSLEAARRGAHWVRVHNVKKTLQALTVHNALKVA